MGNYLVSPTQIDRASIRGLDGLAKTVSHIFQTTNSDLVVLGVALFRVSADTEPALLRETKEFIREHLGMATPIFDATIRELKSGQRASRHHGELAHELEKSAAAHAGEWFRHLRDGTKPTRRFSSASSKFAADYENLSREIMERMIDAQQRRQQRGNTIDLTETETASEVVPS